MTCGAVYSVMQKTGYWVTVNHRRTTVSYTLPRDLAMTDFF